MTLRLVIEYRLYYAEVRYHRSATLNCQEMSHGIQENHPYSLHLSMEQSIYSISTSTHNNKNVIMTQTITKYSNMT
jgi:hypothetical protein